MRSIGHSIKEQYANENTCDKKLTERLIGAQAILLFKYGLRLVDILKDENESQFEIYLRCALSKICETLRIIGTLINRVNVGNTYSKEVTDMCTLYFNMFFWHLITIATALFGLWDMLCHTMQGNCTKSTRLGMVS